ncbi:RNA polymerase sigma-70 factor [Geofilum sp. OHC36d9]|uniref:RNA polymerase sigma-70 factor n=1 Tax=Geofilum sp. OHC36d9 TaxID=3458413 RepID=UPI0040346C0C
MSNTPLIPDDITLAAGLKRGEEVAFRYLFDKYYHRLVVFANRLLSDSDLSRSIVQDVFVMLYDKKAEITIHTSLNAMMHQMVRNRCLNYIKRDKMKREHHQQIFLQSNESELPVQSLEYEELETAINEVIEDLPVQCQRIFKLSRFKGQTNQEIADALSLSKRTVETQISNALKRLRVELRQRDLLPPLLSLLCLFLFF